MIQKQMKIEGQLAPCQGCKGQPKVYHVHGKGRWLLECAPCGVRTAKHGTLQEAVEAWEVGERVAA